MALTPHASNPERRKQLKEINDLVESGEEGQGSAKQLWNASSKGPVADPVVPPAPSQENPEGPDAGKGKGKGK